MENINEPLMSAIGFYKTLDKNYTITELMDLYANYKTKWHLKQAEKSVVDRCHFISTKYNTLINETIITNAFDNYITNNLK